MSRFVHNANLPHQADTVLLGQKYADSLKEPLISRGICPLFVPDNPYVDKRLSGHADLSVFHAGRDKLILAPFLMGSGLERDLKRLGADVVFAHIEQGKDYPHDAQLNACAVGESCICRKNVTAREIVESFRNILYCRQGYVKCSVCVVDEHSVMTEDRGVADVCRRAGMDVLLLTPGHVRLDGFACGFIGGAAFRLSDKVIAFTGRLDGHPDGKNILEYIEKRRFSPLFLTDEPLFDVGSVLPLTEK